MSGSVDVRALLHLLAVILALPQLLIALAFLLLGHVTGARSFGGFLTRTLDVLALLFGWGGLLALIAVVMLIAAGFVVEWQRVAAAAVALLVVASAVALIAQLGAPPLDALFFFIPGLAALAVSVLLAVRPATAATTS